MALKTRLIFILTILLFASLACKAVSSEQTEPVATQPVAPATSTALPEPEPTAEPPATESPTAEPAPTEPPAAEPTQAVDLGPLPGLPPANPGPETLDLESLPTGISGADFSIGDFTQVMRLEMRWTDNDGVDQESVSTYTYREQTRPQTAWSLYYDDQNPFFPSTIESVVTGEQAFSSTPESGCFVVSPEKVPQDEPRQSFLSLLQALTGQASRSQSETMLDEQISDAYTLERQNFTPGSEVTLTASSADSDGDFSSTISSSINLTDEGDTLESATLYLAQEGGFVRRIELVFSRTASEEDSIIAKPGTRMERTLVYDAIPVLVAGGEPVAAPAGCEGAAPSDESGDSGDDYGDDSESLSSSDLPRMQDANNVIELDGTLIYETGASVQEVHDFYVSELEAQGWESGDDMLMGQMASLEFTRGGQTISITILESAGTTMVTVAIT
jgi:hypothetical protein